MNNQPIPVQPHSNFVEMYTVQSESNPKFRYTVALNDVNQWSCSCPAWIWAKPRGNCKHITALLAWRNQQTNLPKLEEAKPATRFTSVEV